jgi:hypothetical protein
VHAADPVCDGHAWPANTIAWPDPPIGWIEAVSESANFQEPWHPHGALSLSREA